MMPPNLWSLTPYWSTYVSRSTSSTDFPGTANSFHPTKRAGQPEDVRDALYSTPLAADTDIRRIVVDSSGSAYITGEADSDDFPTTDGAFQTSLKGGDGFIAKIADQAEPWPA